MANVLGTLFSDIANAIRSKTGSTDKIAPKDFPIQINNIVVGGGGSTTEGWVTLIEQQTVTPSQDTSNGCYSITVPIVEVNALNLAIGTNLIVHLDGVSYPVGVSGIPAKTEAGVTLTTTGAGDWTIRSKIGGIALDYLTTYRGHEPFFVMGGGGNNSTLIMFPNATTHTIKVEYMPRYGTT